MTLSTLPARSTLADDVVPRLGRRRSFNNNKGGVGKSLLTREMAEALARQGRRVLVVDMEPQGNVSRRLAVHDIDPARTIGAVLARKVKGGAAEAIYPCGWDSPEAALIDVIPADLTLADRDREAGDAGSHGRLAKVLYGVTDDYDFTLFDCRPTLGHLEQMVVRALDGDGDGYYLVVEPEADAITGAYRVIQEMAQWAEDMEVGAPALGVIVNKYDGRTNLHTGRAGSVAASLTTRDESGATLLDPPPVLTPYVRHAIRIAEVQDMALPSTGDPRLKREGHLTAFDQLAEAINW